MRKNADHKRGSNLTMYPNLYLYPYQYLYLYPISGCILQFYFFILKDVSWSHDGCYTMSHDNMKIQCYCQVKKDGLELNFCQKVDSTSDDPLVFAAGKIPEIEVSGVFIFTYICIVLSTLLLIFSIYYVFKYMK